nr:MAG TPA: hypothetical protein [Caudoviricetes sp.]
MKDISKLSYQNRLRIFEAEKKKLYSQKLSFKEFEQKIKELAEKYGL